MKKYKQETLLAYPHLVAQFHPNKNGELTPESISSGSDKKIWWKCPKGPDHEWDAVVKSRTKGRNKCPFCANKKLSVTNSLQTLFPEIAAELHPTKNNGITADKIIATTKKKYWWKCDKGVDHEWETAVYLRTKEKKGCRFCGKKDATEEYSLAKLYPYLAEEFDIEKNGIDPHQVLPNSHKKYHWKCKNNPSHTWEANPNNRVQAKSDCPWCTIIPRSKAEIQLAFELLHFIPFDIDNHKVLINGIVQDVDIILPEYKIIVEYDGQYWHSDCQAKDKKKTKALKEIGWHVIRVREEPLCKLSKDDIEFPVGNIKAAVNNLLMKISEIRGVPLAEKEALYIKKDKLINSGAANKYIRQLLEKKQEILKEQK